MLKLFLGAFGAYMLGRVLGMRFGGALLTGVVFAFGTFFVVWLAWPLTSVYACIPWALAPDRAAGPTTRAASASPGWPPWSACSSWAAIPSRAFTCMFVPWCSSCSGAARGAAGACRTARRW